MKNQNEETLTKVHEGILKLLSGFNRTFGKNYCRPSQELMLKRLKEFHGIEISLRTLNRRLKELREWGYLWKIVRHIRGKGIKMVCGVQPTIYLKRLVNISWESNEQTRGSLFVLGLPNLATD